MIAVNHVFEVFLRAKASLRLEHPVSFSLFLSLSLSLDLVWQNSKTDRRSLRGLIVGLQKKRKRKRGREREREKSYGLTGMRKAAVNCDKAKVALAGDSSGPTAQQLRDAPHACKCSVLQLATRLGPTGVRAMQHSALHGPLRRQLPFSRVMHSRKLTRRNLARNLKEKEGKRKTEKPFHPRAPSRRDVLSWRNPRF